MTIGSCLSLTSNVQSWTTFIVCLSLERKRFLTGIDLDKHILSFMLHLLAFAYCISTGIRVDNPIKLQKWRQSANVSNWSQYNQFQVSCSTLCLPDVDLVFCYSISQPYTLDRFDYINENNFQREIFTSVRSLMLCTNNQLTFEH